MAGLFVRKGDLVQVLSGKDRGITGKVIEVYPETGRVIVEGVNRIKKHTKVGQSNRGAKTGGIITTEAPMMIVPFSLELVAPPLATWSKTSASWSPRKIEMIAGGASCAPRR